MRSFILLSILAGLGHALPQDICSTTTKQVIVPTRTATYYTNPVVTKRASTAKNLGTYTQVTTISTTTTLQTITATVGSCDVTGIATVAGATETIYSPWSAEAAPSKRDLGIAPRACTVTVTSTTTYGQTHLWVTGSSTSTYTEYTAFTQATVTSTRTGGKAYAIASAVVTTSQACGDTTVTRSSVTQTVTRDPHCSPSAMVSSYNNFGIDWLSDTPTGGATYITNTSDASLCCQLCAEADSCAASAWDIRSGKCRLEFSVSTDDGKMNCGQGLLGYYDAGPNSPMSPGAGWYVARMCGNIQFGSSKPDDGS